MKLCLLIITSFILFINVLIMNLFHNKSYKDYLKNEKDFIHCRNDKLIASKGNREIVLRGFCYTGFSYFSPSIPINIEERVYTDLVEMGMNTIRLSLSYHLFYDSDKPGVYKDSIWDWINKHIALAKKHNVYIILQLTQIEGAQFTPIPNMPYDFRIWEDKEIQDHFISLWVEIARKYHDEKNIAGYSIFCEPVCSRAVTQWSDLANYTIQEIREFDKNHIIFLERSYGEYGVRRELTNEEIPAMDAFFKVDDKNVVYEFYFFETDDYTHQYASWRPELQKSAQYPDPETIINFNEKGGQKKEFRFDKEYLDFYLQKQTEFGRAEKVPMSVWGFGLTNNCFTDQNGGLHWMNDAVELFNSYHLNWTIFYNSPFFGIKDNTEVKRLLQQNVK
jgi:aryl-phospho-beta-D-glucosidase BglC (GH1 family)